VLKIKRIHLVILELRDMEARAFALPKKLVLDLSVLLFIRRESLLPHEADFAPTVCILVLDCWDSVDTVPCEIDRFTDSWDDITLLKSDPTETFLEVLA